MEILDVFGLLALAALDVGLSALLALRRRAFHGQFRTHLTPAKSAGLSSSAGPTTAT